jgi:hypothetical protein
MRCETKHGHSVYTNICICAKLYAFYGERGGGGGGGITVSLPLYKIFLKIYINFQKMDRAWDQMERAERAPHRRRLFSWNKDDVQLQEDGEK